MDSHGWNYHESDPDGMSPGDELSLAIKKYLIGMKHFLKQMSALVTMIGWRPARYSLLECHRNGYVHTTTYLGTPGWNWVENIVYDDVLYEHGEGGQAQMKAKNNMMSSVCGHTHTEAYVKWFVGKRFRVFGMQTACGIDIKSYATAYAKNFKRQALGVGVVLGGHTAFNCMMDL